jgi:GT2 family glycosyltransferase
MPNTNISMLVTSCNRHDLLKATLESFYAICDQEPQELIVFEDSEAEMPEFLKDFKWKQRNLIWIAGHERRGQAFACAKLITEAKHDFVFWCEDDW